MNIYLDIDGVLLTKNMRAATHADVFIKYVIENYPETTYWLTTRCQGDATKPVRELAEFFDKETVKLLERIKPTTWVHSPLKTSAIDFSKPFLWFDDYPFDADKRVLFEHNTLDNWIKVDLVKNPNQLGDFIDDFPLPVEA